MRQRRSSTACRRTAALSSEPPTAPHLSVFCCGGRLGCYRVDMVEGGLTLLDMHLCALCVRTPWCDLFATDVHTLASVGI